MAEGSLDGEGICIMLTGCLAFACDLFKVNIYQPASHLAT